jgi:hypothetical protein
LVSIGNDGVEQSVGLSRALVPVAPMSTEGGLTPPALANVRPNAPFLTQLIATADGHPQTRARRRADPNWATTTYAAMMRAPAASGRAVHESR